MSKLSKLKKEAYQAGKRQDWEAAVSIYERILEIDKNNPTLINELGDICLRMEDFSTAQRHFLAAAAKYRNTGLQNNAVAIYKKVLRHAPDNLNAHWFLAEIRAGQGLIVEGERHALSFLASGDASAPESKEIFLKRCLELMTLYGKSQKILERLRAIFNSWGKSLEVARVDCMLACLAYDAGEPDKAEREVSTLLETNPELVNYPEYGAWRGRIDPQPVPVESSDVNAIDLGGGETETPLPEIELPSVDEDQPVPLNDRPGSAPSLLEPVPPATGLAEPTLAEPLEREDGCLVIPVDDPENPEDPPSTLPHSAAGETAPPAAGAGGSGPVRSSFDDLIRSIPSAGNELPEPPQEESVDLLAEILADEAGDLKKVEEDQLDTIASEIGQRVGGESGPADPASSYEMGMVYLEMGLLDQAADCFESAAADAEFAMRSIEMWGITLVRMGRADEATEVLARGLTGEDSEEVLGLIYHTGRAHEEAGRTEEALRWYERAQAISAGFLDVTQRLAELTPT